MQPDAILNYCRKVRSYPQEGEERFRALYDDLRLIEKQLNLRLIPNNMQSADCVTLFTR